MSPSTLDVLILIFCLKKWKSLKRYLMAAMSGTLRSEAMLTKGAAHFVRFLGQGHGDRAITVRADEYEYGLSLLELRRRMRQAPKSVLQAVCSDARTQLRVGKSFDVAFGSRRPDKHKESPEREADSSRSTSKAQKEKQTRLQ